MSALIQGFDPSNPTTGFIPLNMPNGGWLLLMNESVVGLKLTFQDGTQRILNPLCLRMFQLDQSQSGGPCQYSTAYAFQSGAAPSSLVIGEALAPTEWDGGEFIIPLGGRVTNIGNGVPLSTSASSVVNDGNAVGTTVLETTETGQSSSQIKMLNDGTVTVNPLNAGSLKQVLVITPGGASAHATGSFGDSGNPANWNLYGTLAPANILSGALPGGVTIAASQVGSGYPVASIGSGALPTGISVAPANLTGSGAVPSGWTVGAGQITAGNLNIGSGTLSTDSGGVTTDGSGDLVLQALGSPALKVAWNGSTGATSWRALDIDFTHANTGHVMSFAFSQQNIMGIYDYSAGGNYAALFKGAGAGVQLGGRGIFVGGMGFFSGTGSGTFNHGAGATPSQVQVTCKQVNSSQTQGTDSWTSTTVHVTSGAGFGWSGVAFV